MCGVTGIISKNKNIPYLSDLLNPMVESLNHRGPDSKGIYFDENNGVALGHNRLSIIDLSTKGHQPMVSNSGRYIISFNGEIYNHLLLRNKIGVNSWVGTSDTETILSAIEKWGIETTLEQLNGMFAFALYDKLGGGIHLCRDRAGEKPMYYGEISGDFIFASELKAFLVHPKFKREVNRKVLATYMKYGYVPAPYTIYKDVKKIPAGCHLIVNNGMDIKLRKYWSLGKSTTANDHSINDESQIRRLKELLLSSVEQQMISDVPLGVFLSGGIDSSMVASMMQSVSNKPIDTFSIGFNEKEYDESSYARSISNYLNTHHHELIIDSKMSLDVVTELPNIYDEPFADASGIPTYILAKMSRNNVTVSLSGDGADELFGGYERYYKGMGYWSKINLIPLPIRRIMKNILLSFSNDFYNRINNPYFNSGKLGYKVHKIMQGLDSSSSSEFMQRIVSIWNDPDDVVLSGYSLDTEYQINSINDFIDDESYAMYCDFKAYLPDDILVKVDRAAMAVSLETRAPFLDYRIIEFANALPTHYKIRNGMSKWILKQVLYEYIPSKYFNRPKTGFSVPIDSWLRGPLKEWAWDLINPKKLDDEGYFNSSIIHDKWNQHQDGKGNYQYQLWNVLMFQTWLNKINEIC